MDRLLLFFCNLFYNDLKGRKLPTKGVIGLNLVGATIVTLVQQQSGLCRIVINQKGKQQVKHVISDTLACEIIALIDQKPTLHRDLTRMEALELLNLRQVCI